jgi:hypothetical protein
LGPIEDFWVANWSQVTNELVWPVPLAQVLSHPQLIFHFKTWFFWNLFEFAAAEIT